MSVIYYFIKATRAQPGFDFRNSFTYVSAIFSLAWMMSMSSFGVAMPRLL
jgi:hypothetical protein